MYRQKFNRFYYCRLFFRFILCIEKQMLLNKWLSRSQVAWIGTHKRNQFKYLAKALKPRDTLSKWHLLLYRKNLDFFWKLYRWCTQNMYIYYELLFTTSNMVYKYSIIYMYFESIQCYTTTHYYYTIQILHRYTYVQEAIRLNYTLKKISLLRFKVFPAMFVLAWKYGISFE